MSVICHHLSVRHFFRYLGFDFEAVKPIDTENSFSLHAIEMYIYS